MSLIAYALGQNIVAAPTPQAALALMDSCEWPGRWRLDDVRELTDAELACQVDETSPETVSQALSRAQAAGPRSRLDAVWANGAQLIRWDYPLDSPPQDRLI